MERMFNPRLKYLTDLLIKSYEEHAEIIKVDSLHLLNRERLVGILEKLRNLVFPGYFGKKGISFSSVEYYAGDILEEVLYALSKETARALQYNPYYGGLGKELLEEKAADISFRFLARLPEVREYLAQDVSAAFDGDPAAANLDEIISSYPGIYAIMAYRLAHILYDLEVPLIPRIMTEYAHNLTGIDIHPGAVIGHHFFIDHGTGIVIGETTVIGNYVKIYQGVTLGGLSTRGGQTLKGVKRHPTIEHHVTIYSGASILGGSTVIGEGVVIGSNAFVTKSVPEKTRVSVKNPELQFKSDGQSPPAHAELYQNEFWDWVI
ncbi:serine acetyltransferase [Treponema sp. TIM-1]|uniref:serine O-acetyltransferase EpsC n=1 Tax=Treponema sp. TIM-1 TaxID=2898417 RepID=UPI00397F3B82